MGESEQEMLEQVEWTARILPREKPVCHGSWNAHSIVENDCYGS